MSHTHAAPCGDGRFHAATGADAIPEAVQPPPAALDVRGKVLTGPRSAMAARCTR